MTRTPANDFLEIASEQRLSIILKLNKEKSKLSAMAKDLGATVPEVFRNFERLTKAGLIHKDVDGYYSLTTYGNTLCIQIPSLNFLSKNKKYFTEHDFAGLPTKFIQRIGSLESGKLVNGFVKVLEYWKEIYNNADDYICSILYEVPYSPDLIETLVKKMKNKTKLKSIFSESAIIPKERKEIFEKYNFSKFVKDGIMERKMLSDVKTVVLVNDKEACVMFPKSSGEADLSQAFYSKDSDFHEWCIDYFNDCWQNSGAFQENKLRTDD